MSKARCQDCGVDKLQSDFYEKHDKKTGRIRFDCVCMECRRQKRKSQYKEKRAYATASKRIIEPESSVKFSKKVVDVSQDARIRHVNKVDFSDTEESYGKQLTYNERLEIVQRFNEFIGILREGYGEITGEQVFIRKDQ